MIGSFDFRDPSRKVLVVGGGVAGLLASVILDQNDYEVTLIEKSESLGGMLRTEKTSFGIAEHAAHSFLATPRFQRFCQELGVKLLPVNEHSRARFILRKGKFRQLPLSILELLKTLGRVAFVRSQGVEGGWTLDRWSNRFLGEKATSYLLTPFVRGVFGCRLSQLQVRASFPALVIPRGHSFLSFLLIKKWKEFWNNNKKMPRAKMMAPQGGMGDFTEKLGCYLKERLGDRLKTKTELSDFSSLKDFKNVILAIPPADLIPLFQKSDPKFAQSLSSISYSALVSATVFVKKSSLSRKQNGVGVLVPEDEECRFLGILFNSSSFANRTQDPEIFSCTVMFGESYLHKDDTEIRQIIQEELQQKMGLTKPIEDLFIRRWKKAIPHYNSALTEAWSIARLGWSASPGKMLFSNFTGELSIRKMAETLFVLEKQNQEKA